LLTNSRDGAQRRRELLTSGGGTGARLARQPEHVRNREMVRDANCSKQWRNVRGAEQSTNGQPNRLRKKIGSAGGIRTGDFLVNAFAYARIGATSHPPRAPSDNRVTTRSAPAEIHHNMFPQ